MSNMGIRSLKGLIVKQPQERATLTNSEKIEIAEAGASLEAAVAKAANERTWAAAGVGMHVIMTKRGHTPFLGTVDDRTADGTVLWVLSATGIRKLFHIDDGFILSPAPR